MQVLHIDIYKNTQISVYTQQNSNMKILFFIKSNYCTPNFNIAFISIYMYVIKANKFLENMVTRSPNITTIRLMSFILG